MARPVSGDQYSICHGRYSAEVSSVGATLRALRLDDRDLVLPFEASQLRPHYRGATLAPWPNRVVDGRYSFAGSEYQLALSEPKRGHALHGLVAWQQFDALGVADDEVVLGTRLEAQQGYPFPLSIAVRFRLTTQGLTWTVTATNLGDKPAPYGTAPHPYLVAGAGRVDDWALELSAARVLHVTPERLVPTELRAVDAGDAAFDFRSGRRIGATEIDHAYTGLAWTDRTATAVVRDVSGAGAGISWQEDCPWVQVHTGDLPERPAESRRGLAVEPMTCPPDAFNSGTDLVVLEPGGRHSVEWRLFGVDADRV